jgi:hypothetical protein
MKDNIYQDLPKCSGENKGKNTNFFIMQQINYI